ncbi:MAG: hypothetical protein CMH56_13835 [Myxococcales bacterium]|nr:hypothetical protein [Myxococcales bacterium]|tara:strand:- start:738 stop:1883 length:1146 start_codon:yes stop_codon:yes gene_type:complete
MIGSISRGDMLQASLQALGMGQKSAAMRGAMLDLKSGDLLGYHKNMFEASTGFDPGKMGALGMASPFGVLNPFSALAQLKGLKGVKTGRVKSRRSYHTPFGTSQIERRDLRGRGFFGRLKGRALERRLKRDPIFRAKFEAKVGGQYVPDGRNDGKVTIRRFKPNLLGLSAGIQNSLAGNMMAMTALGGLAMMQAHAAGLMQGLAAGGASGSSNASGNASSGGSSQGLQGKPGSAVSKLGPHATFEDLVAAFMFDVVKEQQEEIKKKMAELNPKAKSGGAKKGRGGFGGFLKKLAPMAGKALGTAFGGPVGGMIGGAVGNAVGGSGKSGSAQGGQSASDSRQLKMEELKNLMQKLQQMQQALSNVLNSMHQGAMNSIRNIRA